MATGVVGDPPRLECARCSGIPGRQEESEASKEKNRIASFWCVLRVGRQGLGSRMIHLA